MIAVVLLGGLLGILNSTMAAVAHRHPRRCLRHLIAQTASDPTAGFHGIFWLVLAMIAIILAAIPLLPARPQPPTAPAVPEELATSGRAS